jgi:inner membrane protein
MDSLTHIALGGIVGEVMLGRQLPKKAILLGAVVHNFPDIDFIASFWLAPADNVLAHRGFTHSIVSVLLFSFIFYQTAIYWDKQNRVQPRQWLLFFFTLLSLHLFIDAFNAYGVGWFIPFSDARISFHLLFVFDPFFFLLLLTPFLWVLFCQPALRLQVARVALILACLYPAYGLINKLLVEEKIKKLITRQNISYHRHFTTPTPLNTWLWFVVAEADSGYYLTYRSVFDRSDSVALTFVPRNEHMLAGYEQDHAVKQLKKFSQGYYTIQSRGDTLVLNDLRFGQISGWQNPRAPFTFHYFVNYPDANLLVMQRGRFANWNRETVKAMFRRIRGK